MCLQFGISGANRSLTGEFISRPQQLCGIDKRENKPHLRLSPTLKMDGMPVECIGQIEINLAVVDRLGCSLKPAGETTSRFLLGLKFGQDLVDRQHCSELRNKGDCFETRVHR